MEKEETIIANGLYKSRSCVNYKNIKVMIEEELDENYEPVMMGKSDTFLSTGAMKKGGNYTVVFKKKE